jgi:hypothetical protein
MFSAIFLATVGHKQLLSAGTWKICKLWRSTPYSLIDLLFFCFECTLFGRIFPCQNLSAAGYICVQDSGISGHCDRTNLRYWVCVCTWLGVVSGSICLCLGEINKLRYFASLLMLLMNSLLLIEILSQRW